ncbi:MAG: deoxyguanosinetriphosphate triphosphohydrolase [Ignavibacteriales bacterium]|nr:deoxyguanosinetriphosphate triphosphohydrolase [Ignavibacteriales bacterium]
MEWKLLLTDDRLGIDKSQSTKKDGRSQFQKDFDRIVFSPAFRRLQDKTQVFPLPESDFVHTRLTHSLEVSVVGRSVGNLVGEQIIARHPKLKKDFTQFHFGEIVAASCLAHDIGNPPFGHSGEDAIAEYFKNGNGKKFKDEIADEKKWNDLIRFEGNAQGFRIITKLLNRDVNGGLQLTYATLSALNKYPKESLSDIEIEKAAGHKNIYKKFGFFQSEKDIFKLVAEKTGLDKPEKSEKYLWSRHPLSFLVEAADDICYSIMDLEDGFRLGLLSFKETENLLIPLIHKRDLTGYKNRDDNEKVGYLRAKAISDLVNDIAAVFVENEKEILQASFNKELVTVIKKTSALKKIERASIAKIYRHRSVVEREAAGYEVLGGLLDTFITAYNEYSENKLSPKNRAIINLIPRRFFYEEKQNPELYHRLLRIIDFVSGMTDSYAVSIYRKIKGISLPGGRVTE